MTCSMTQGSEADEATPWSRVKHSTTEPLRSPPELPGWTKSITPFFVLINSVGPDLGLDCLQRLTADSKKKLKLTCSTDMHPN